MPQDASPAKETQAAAGEFSAVWVADASHAAGPLGFFIGPLIGPIINYVKRNGAEAGFIAAHHRWLIRTFWWTLAAYVACIVVNVAGVWPIVGDCVIGTIGSGGGARRPLSLSLSCDSIFATVGTARLGGPGMVVT